MLTFQDAPNDAFCHEFRVRYCNAAESDVYDRLVVDPCPRHPVEECLWWFPTQFRVFKEPADGKGLVHAQTYSTEI